MENQIFFPQSAVDVWGIDGKIDLVAGELVLLGHGRRYKVEECVRVVTEVSGASDAHAIVGKVKPKRALVEAGAEIMENSLILGDNAYDTEPGWMGTPTMPFADYLVSAERLRPTGAEADPGTEEEFLLRFLGERT